MEEFQQYQHCAAYSGTPNCSDVKDWTHKDKDQSHQDKDWTHKDQDQDQDKDQSHKGKDWTHKDWTCKDKDLTLVLRSP